MKNRDIQRQIDSLTDLFARAPIACAGDLELEAHWARYLCVRLTGLLEYSIKSIYADYISREATQYVSQFAGATLDVSLRNPDSGALLGFVGKFHLGWQSDLKEFLTEDDRGGAVTSLMKIRNAIAHGTEKEITFHRLSEYKPKVIAVIEFIENQCS